MASHSRKLETSKTILLNILIAVSFMLSWMVWNSQPNYEYIRPSEYVKPQPLGKAQQLSELVLPISILFHYGENRHTKALPDTVYYRLVNSGMKNWYFYDIKPVTLSKDQWNHIMQEAKGLEILYPDDLPFSILNESVAFGGEIDKAFQAAGKIWLYYDEAAAQVQALFIAEETNAVMEARTAFSKDDLENFLALGNELPPQQMMLQQKAESETLREWGESRDFVPNMYYVPLEKVVMKQFRFFYQPVTMQRFIQLLFVDPSLIRQVVERDGTIIFTDGSRAVQVPPHRRTISYHDPVLEPVGNQALPNNPGAAIEFVNQNGGWTGNFQLEEIFSTVGSKRETYRFRLYERSYPVFGSPEEKLGEMEIRLEGTFITGFERPLYLMDRYFDYEDKVLPSGPEIWALLPKLGIDRGRVKDYYPAYRMEMSEDYLNLFPVWVVETGEEDPVFVEHIQENEDQGNGHIEEGT